jgi:hypothetical protein
MAIDLKRSFVIPFKSTNSDELLTVYLIAFGITVLTAILQVAMQFASNFAGMSFGPYASENTALPIAIGGMICVFSLLMFLINIIIYSLLTGYTIETIKLEIAGHEFVMPPWQNNFLKFFVKGLLFFFIIVIYVILLTAIAMIPVLIALAIYFSMGGSTSNTGQIFDNFIGPASVLITLAISGLFTLCFLLLYPFLMVNFAAKNSFLAAFNILKAINIIIKNFNDYIIAIMVSLLVIIAMFFVMIGLCCTCIGYIFVPLISQFIVPIIIMNMFAQIYRQQTS